MAAIVPFLGLLAFNIYSHAEADVGAAQANVSRNAESIALGVERLVHHVDEMLTPIAHRPLIMALDPKNCDPEFGEFAKMMPQADNLVTFAADGRLVCSALIPTATGSAPPLVDPAHFLNQANRTRTFTVGTIAPGLLNGIWIVTLSKPIIDGAGQFRGVVTLSLDLVRFSPAGNDVSLPPQALAGIIDSRGIILARSSEPEKWVGRHAVVPNQVRGLLQGGDRIGRGKGLDDVERIYAFQHIRGTDWDAVVGVPVSQVYAPVRFNTAVSIAVAICTAILAAGLCFVFAQGIAKPVRAIAEGAQQVAAGNMNERVEPGGPVEIADVADQFNKMLVAWAGAEHQRAEAEERIRSSEARFRAIFEQAGFGVALVDPRDRRILQCNRALADMLGYTIDEVVGLTIEDVSETDDHEQYQKFWQGLIDGTGTRFQMERRYLRKDGKVVLGFLTATLVRGEDAKPQFLIGMIEDITEMRRSQFEVHRLAHQLTATFESITDGFVTFDRDWHITYVNSEAERLFRRTRADLLGKVVWEEFKEAVDSSFYREYHRAMRTKRTVEFEEYYPALEIWLEVRAYPSDEGLAAYMRDVTQRKQIEEQLRTVSDRLLSVQETERAALARELHDEFGQVLTAVKLQLQALAQRTPSPRLEDCVALVDQMLSQVRSLSLDLRPAQLDDEGLAVAMRSHLTRLSRQTGRVITFECGPEVPCLTGKRATACFRIVQEAVTNALRHSNAGVIHVVLGLEGEFVCMVIRDDGIGFDPQRTRANSLSGSNIGLLGMQDRVDILGGSLEVRSSPGSGTEIRVRIPLQSLKTAVA